MKKQRRREPGVPETTDVDEMRVAVPTTRSLMDELEVMDLQVKAAGEDEMRTMFDPTVHPKKPHPKEEGITDLEGTRAVDLMTDTPKIEDEVEFDLTDEEIRDADLF